MALRVHRALIRLAAILPMTDMGLTNGFWDRPLTDIADDGLAKTLTVNDSILYSQEITFDIALKYTLKVVVEITR